MNATAIHPAVMENEIRKAIDATLGIRLVTVADLTWDFDTQEGN